jgi:exodeoxyribonuclease VII small subunit
VSGAEPTFEQLVADLEKLTDRMAVGDIGIEEATDLYERAGRLHALAAERLARVQERIERLGVHDDEALGGTGEGDVEAP